MSNYRYLKFSDENKVSIIEKSRILLFNLLYTILLFSNLSIFVAIIYLKYSQHWINFLNIETLLITCCCAFLTLFTLILSPCKRKNNLQVQLSFLYLIIAVIIIQVIVCIEIYSFQTDLEKTINIENSTLRHIDNFRDVFLVNECKTRNNTINCNRRGKWFQDYINKCPITKNSSFTLCLDRNNDYYPDIKNIYCLKDTCILTHLIVIVKIMFITSIINLFIDIYLAIKVYQVYRILKNKARIPSELLEI